MERGEENIYKRKDGRWEGRYYKGRKSNGSIRYGYVYRYSYNEVRLALQLKRINLHTSSAAADQFIGSCKDWFYLWLSYDVKPRVKPTTFTSYHRKCQKHILPEIGHIPLNQLTTVHIQQLVNQWQAQFSQTTITILYRILTNGLEAAVNQQCLMMNPCQNIIFA